MPEPRKPATPRAPEDKAAKEAGLPTGSEPQRFRVLRPFRGDRDYAVDEVIEVDASWPFRRAAQLTRRRYILPLVND